MNSKDSNDPITLITRVSVKDELTTEYIELAEQTSLAARSSEEGIIYQHFGKNEESTNLYTWIELFTNEKAYLIN